MQVERTIVFSKKTDPMLVPSVDTTTSSDQDTNGNLNRLLMELESIPNMILKSKARSTFANWGLGLNA